MPTQDPGPRQPAPGSGEPRKRLKLRSAMLNYVSCLGMTTYKVSANIRFQRTSKSAFLFGGPGTFLFGKHKKKCPRNSPPPYKRRPLNIPDIYFIIFFNL